VSKLAFSAFVHVNNWWHNPVTWFTGILNPCRSSTVHYRLNAKRLLHKCPVAKHAFLNFCSPTPFLSLCIRHNIGHLPASFFAKSIEFKSVVSSPNCFRGGGDRAIPIKSRLTPGAHKWCLLSPSLPMGAFPIIAPNAWGYTFRIGDEGIVPGDAHWSLVNEKKVQRLDVPDHSGID
jgi:hypothetical protein